MSEGRQEFTQEMQRKDSINSNVTAATSCCPVEPSADTVGPLPGPVAKKRNSWMDICLVAAKESEESPQESQADCEMARDDADTVSCSSSTTFSQGYNGPSRVRLPSLSGLDMLTQAVSHQQRRASVSMIAPFRRKSLAPLSEHFADINVSGGGRPRSSSFDLTSLSRPGLPSILTSSLNPNQTQNYQSSARAPHPHHHIYSAQQRAHAVMDSRIFSPPLISAASPLSSSNSPSTGYTSSSASPTPNLNRFQQSPTYQPPSAPSPLKKERTCASCFADYSSGNWYKDKERPGCYMCKSCYVCLNRKKRKSISGPNADTPYASPPLQTSPTSPQNAMLQIRQRRKPSNREELQNRVCASCTSNHSSGDWYRDQSGPNMFNCQKCYQRKNREKVKKRTEKMLMEYRNLSQAAAAQIQQKQQEASPLAQSPGDDLNAQQEAAGLVKDEPMIENSIPSPDSININLEVVV